MSKYTTRVRNIVKALLVPKRDLLILFKPERIKQSIALVRENPKLLPDAEL